MVVPSIWMRRRFFLAASMPFRIADGTSLALPTPKPTTRAAGSPITTSAEKLRFLPPLTTLVTRLIDTTCSFRLSDCGSMRFTIFAAIKTPVRLPARRRPGPSRGRDKYNRRGRTPPSEFPFLWRAQRPACRPSWRQPDCRPWCACPSRWSKQKPAWRPGYRRSPARRCWPRCGKPPAAAVRRCREPCAGCARESGAGSHSFALRGSFCTRPGLTDLLAQLLAGIADALILVGIRLAQRANVRRHLAHHLLVVAAQHQVGLLIDLEVHAIRQQDFDGMRVAQREGGHLSLDVGAVADAHDVQFLGEPGGNTLHGVAGQGPRQAVQRAVLIAIAHDIQAAVGLLDVYAARDGDGQGTLWSADLQFFADLNLDSLGERDRLFTNSRHSSNPS